MPKEIIVAKSAGFCLGVKKALETAEKLGEASIYGSLIHNPQEVERLNRTGKRIVQDLDAVKTRQVVITAHGLDLAVVEEMQRRGLTIIDTTCSLVKHIYREGLALQEKGFRIVIIGDPDHVEVRGIASRMKDPLVIFKEGDLDRVPPGIRIGVICQSTLLQEKFTRFTEALRPGHPDMTAVNTICKPTRDRQDSAEEIARQVQAMVIVGGKNSSNTNKLAVVCEKQLGPDAHHIETAEELRAEWFTGREKVGVTAGTSTPDYLIREVIARIRSFDPVPARVTFL